MERFMELVLLEFRRGFDHHLIPELKLKLERISIRNRNRNLWILGSPGLGGIQHRQLLPELRLHTWVGRKESATHTHHKTNHNSKQ